MRTIVSLGTNNAGDLFIGVDEVDENDMGVRSYVLAAQHDGYPAASVMERRFEDLKRIVAVDTVFVDGIQPYEDPIANIVEDDE